jgi:hypothetical protein
MAYKAKGGAPTSRIDEAKRWLGWIAEAKTNRARHESVWKANYIATYGDEWNQKDNSKTIEVDWSRSQTYKMDMILSFIKTSLPNLVFHNPEIILNARPATELNFEGAQEEAKRLEKYMNRKLADVKNLTKQIRVGIIDAHCAQGCYTASVTPEWILNDKAGLPKVSTDTGQPLFNPEDPSQPLMEPDEIINRIIVKVRRKDPFRILIDPKCEEDWDEALWRGEEITKTIAQIEDQEGLDKKVIAKIKRKYNKSGDKDNSEIEVTLYKIYHRKDQEFLLLCDGINDFLLSSVTASTTFC